MLVLLLSVRSVLWASPGPDALALAPATAQPQSAGASHPAAPIPASLRARCDVCPVIAPSESKPFSLSGRWLFSRDDRPDHGALSPDWTGWTTVTAPGPWRHAYGDGRHFKVGWYRAEIQWPASAVGQAQVLLVNAYMNPVSVWVDGQPVYARPSPQSEQRYHSVQAIPIRFTPSSPRTWLALRVESPFMTGIYQLPFEIRPHLPHDPVLLGWQWWGGELRFASAAVSVVFGLFFWLIFRRVRDRRYAWAAISSLAITPYLLLPSDFLLALFPAEPLYYLHFLGLSWAYAYFRMTEAFDRPWPLMRRLLGPWLIGASLGIAAMALRPVPEVFMPLRALMLSGVLLAGLASMALLTQASRRGVPGAQVLLAGCVIQIIAGLNDFLMAMGLWPSVSLMFTGITLAQGSVLAVASLHFTQRFVDQQRLMEELTHVNAHVDAWAQDKQARLEACAEALAGLAHAPAILSAELRVLGQQVMLHAKWGGPGADALDTPWPVPADARSLMDWLWQHDASAAPDLDGVWPLVVKQLSSPLVQDDELLPLLPTALDAPGPDMLYHPLSLVWHLTQEPAPVLRLQVHDLLQPAMLKAQIRSLMGEIQLLLEISELGSLHFLRLLDALRQQATPIRDTLEHLFASQHLSSEQLIDLQKRLSLMAQWAERHDLHTLRACVLSLSHVLSPWQYTMPDREAIQHARERLGALVQCLDDHQRIHEEALNREAAQDSAAAADKKEDTPHQPLRDTLDRLTQLSAEQRHQLQHGLTRWGQVLSHWQTVPWNEVIRPVVQGLPAWCQSRGLTPPRVEVHVPEAALHEPAISPLQLALQHLLRQSALHGIERAADRIQLGKSAQGRIVLHADVSPDGIRLVVRDDGRGLPLSQLRQQAAEMLGPVVAGTWSDEALAEMLFLPGEPLPGSARADLQWGLDTVQASLRRLGGELRIRFLGPASSKGDRPFELVIQLPASLGVIERLDELNDHDRNHQTRSEGLAA